MPIDQSFLDELTARCDIVDVVSRYVPLKRQGGNYFGLCPFHNEKSPSFSVAPDKQFFKCFGCGAGGGVITFVMKAEGLEFRDAVQHLADQVGMVVPEEQRDPRAHDRRTRLLALMKDCARFYYDTLWLPENAPVQQYFARRGLTRKVMNRFGLGYAPDSFSATMDAMMKKGYTKEELVDAGLCVRNERGHVYDKFRNRVMFPIIDIRGQVVAFGGRVMDDSKPKYLNSPETYIFHKSRNLFALNLAKKTDKDYFILAEGYMDVIALHQAGFDCAVASLGTSLTEEQARMIARHTRQIIISYDADGAGQAAAQRAIDILKKCDLQVRVLRIPGAKDPDEFIREKGPDAFRRLIERSEGHNVYRLEQIASKYDLEEDDQRIAFLQDAARMLAAVENAIEREVYQNRAAQMAKVTPEAMAHEVKRQMAIRRKQHKRVEHREIRSAAQRVQPQDKRLRYEDVHSARAEEGILSLIFADNTWMDRLKDKIEPSAFSAPVLAKIYAHARTLWDRGSVISIAGFEGYLDEGELALLSDILSRPAMLTGQDKAMADYIAIIERCRAKRGAAAAAGEDPLLALAKQKNANNVGGQ